MINYVNNYENFCMKDGIVDSSQQVFRPAILQIISYYAEKKEISLISHFANNENCFMMYDKVDPTTSNIHATTVG